VNQPRKEAALTSTQPGDSVEASTPVDREALEASLELTRRRFHELVGSLSDDDLALESTVTRWTVKEVLCHMSRVMEIAFALMVRRARRNKGMPKLLHTRLARWLNFMAAKQAARGADRDELLQRYDAANAKMLKLLRTVDDSEWHNPTAFPSGTPLTMERVFSEVIPGHFAAHAAEIEETVARSHGEVFEAPGYRELIEPLS
jgi:uncharacterized damage-inducible protein DinB